MPIKCLASSLNQHCVNVSCYDSQFKFLEIGLVFVKLQINPSSVCLHSCPKTFVHLRMTAMTVMAEHHVCWWERTGLLPMAEGNCSFNPKQILLLSASLSQCWSGWESWITLSLFIYKSIYQQNSKCPPSSDWWGNKAVDRPGHWVWNFASNCVLHAEYQIKVKKKSWENQANLPCATLSITGFSNVRPTFSGLTTEKILSEFSSLKWHV